MVTISMRRQTKASQERGKRDEDMWQRRVMAVQFLREGRKLREVMRICHLSAGTASSLNKRNDFELEKMLDPAHNRAGSKHVLTKKRV